MEIKDELLDISHGNIEKATLPDKAIDMTEWVFTSTPNPGLTQLFHAFYNGAFRNRIGVAHCRHKETGELATILVGVHSDGDDVQLYPLAKVLNELEVNDYEAVTN